MCVCVCATLTHAVVQSAILQTTELAKNLFFLESAEILNKWTRLKQ